MSDNSTLMQLSENLRRKQEEQAEILLELQKEMLKSFENSLRGSLQEELNIISQDIEKIRNTTTKAQKTYIETARKIFNTSLKEIKKTLENIEKEIKEIESKAKQTRLKRWLIPASVAISLLIGLMAGAKAIGTYANEMIAKMLASSAAKREIVGIYKEGIKVKHEPQVFQARDGNWIIIYGGN